MSGVNKVLTLSLIIGMVFAGIVFFQGAVVSTDDNIDMSGSEYQDTHNTTTIIAIQSMSMMNIVLLILAIMTVVIAAKTFGNI